MRGRWWRWPVWLFAAWTVIKIAVRAFSAPWTWTGDQQFFAFLAVAIILGLAIWAVIWKREGLAGVKDRLAKMHRPFDAQPKKTVLLNFAIWIAVAIALVLFFNLKQH